MAPGNVAILKIKAALIYTFFCLRYASDPEIALHIDVYKRQSFGTAQLIAFGCIWVALVLFTLSNQMTTRIKIKK